MASAIACGSAVANTRPPVATSLAGAPSSGQICLARRPRVFMGACTWLGLVPGSGQPIVARLWRQFCRQRFLRPRVIPGGRTPRYCGVLMSPCSAITARITLGRSGAGGIAHPFTCGDGRGRGKQPLRTRVEVRGVASWSCAPPRAGQRRLRRARLGDLIVWPAMT